jgi:hypothetical protein
MSVDPNTGRQTVSIAQRQHDHVRNEYAKAQAETARQRASSALLSITPRPATKVVVQHQHPVGPVAVAGAGLIGWLLGRAERTEPKPPGISRRALFAVLDEAASRGMTEGMSSWAMTEALFRDGQTETPFYELLDMVTEWQEVRHRYG